MGPQSFQNCAQPVLLRLTIYLRLKCMVLMSPVILVVVRWLDGFLRNLGVSGFLENDEHKFI